VTRRSGAATVALLASLATACSEPDANPGTVQTWVDVSVSAVTKTGFLLSWSTPGARGGGCSHGYDVYEDGVRVESPLLSDLADAYGVTTDFPGVYYRRGLAPGERHCYQVPETDTCQGGWSDRTFTWVLASDEICATTLPASAPDDVTAPTVVGIWPPDDAAGPYVAAAVQFSELVDPASVIGTRAIAVQGPRWPVEGYTGFYGPAGQETVLLEFLPVHPFAPESIYTVTVSDAILDLAGNRLVPVSWSFRTQ
jgi:hypothetical protein